MKLTVKKKIWLGTLFLFALILITGGVSIYYTAKLKNNAKNILQANYESLSYCQAMQNEVNNFEKNYYAAANIFESVLRKQENNITEANEKGATITLRKYFDQFKNSDTSKQNVQLIRQQLQQIANLNLLAIRRKNNTAQQSADDALTILIALGGIVFLIAFTFIVNFPSIITKPIIELTDAIKEIANKNYKYRIHIDNKDEFGTLANAFNDMAGRLEYFESSNLNKLMFEKSRAESVINSLKDASIGIDKNNIVLFANQQALQFLGLKSEELVGKQVSEIAKKNDLFRFLIENETAAPFKIVVDNRENYFTKEVIEIEQAESKNKVIVLKNITSFKELDVAKTNFIATISHELKTPLASSDLSIKLLEDERTGTLSTEQKELIGNLKQDNLRMLKILSELLNMSQVESGRIQLNVQAVHPDIIIDNAINTVTSGAREKNISIKKTYNNVLPVIKADADKTTWVLNNFLSNAIKYSQLNSTIEVNAFKKNNEIIFTVRDFGAGIQKEHLPRLFEKYFQVPGAKEKGTGLGLSISKEFIEAQHGKLWVESEIGKGTTFSFLLPILE